MACAFKGCPNTTHYCKGLNIKFFSFPRMKFIRERWIEVCGAREEDLPNRPVVCSMHFKREHIHIGNKKTLLCKSAIPVPEHKEEVPDICVKIEGENSYDSEPIDKIEEQDICEKSVEEYSSYNPKPIDEDEVRGVCVKNKEEHSDCLDVYKAETLQLRDELKRLQTEKAHLVSQLKNI